MRWYQNPYVLWLLFSATVSTILALYAWSRRAQPGVRAFSLLVAATGIWTLAYALEFSTTALDLKLLFVKVQYLGVASIPSLSFLFVVTYLHRHKWLTRPVEVALAGLPLLWNAIVWTNDYHHLNWTSVETTVQGNITTLNFEYGPAFWTAAVFSYLLLATAAALLFREVRRGRSLRRRQSLTIFTGILIPWIGNLVYLSGLNPLPGLDWTPFAYLLSNTVLAWGLFRQQILNVIPVARDVVVEGMEDAVLVLDEELHIVDFNAAAQRLLFEDKGGNLLGHRVTEIAEMNEALLTNILHPPDVVNRIAWESEGKTLYFDVRVSSLNARRDVAVGRVIVLRDITAQITAEEALRESEAHLRAQNAELRKLTEAVKQSASSVVITNLDGEIEYVNPKFEEVTGYTNEEVLGKSTHVLKSGEHSDEFYANLWETIRSGDVWRGQLHNRRKDGTLYWDQVTISPVYNDRDEMTHFIEIREDITAQKEAETRLRSFNERLQILHELDGYLLTLRSPERMARAASARLKRLIPCERIYIQQRQTSNHASIVAAESSHGIPLPKDPRFCKERPHLANLKKGRPVGCPNITALSTLSPCQQQLRDEGLLSYVIIPLITGKDLVGTLHMESNRPQAFTEEHVTIAGEVAALLAVAIRQAWLYARARQEIAERRQIEARLRQYTKELEASNAELDAFAHTVAHDLKSPLSTMLGFSDFLIDSHAKLTPEQIEDNLMYINRSSWRMTSIVEELLLLASVRQQQDIEFAPLDTGTLIKNASQRLASIIGEYEVTIETPETWADAWGYAPWVEEIWVNYLSNAIKYGGDPPVIQLGSDVLENGDVCFWVQDNGRGLTQQEQETLFTEFTRLEEVRAQGHGLGLSIVRRIVERLGGEAGVESTVGEGSRFYFTLPQEKPTSTDG